MSTDRKARLIGHSLEPYSAHIIPKGTRFKIVKDLDKSRLGLYCELEYDDKTINPLLKVFKANGETNTSYITLCNLEYAPKETNQSKPNVEIPIGLPVRTVDSDRVRVLKGSGLEIYGSNYVPKGTAFVVTQEDDSRCGKTIYLTSDDGTFCPFFADEPDGGSQFAKSFSKMTLKSIFDKNDWKVGDTAVGLPIASDRYNITKGGWVGTVTGVRETQINVEGPGLICGDWVDKKYFMKKS